MKKDGIRNLQMILFAAVGLLIAALLLSLWFTPNLSVSSAREASGYTAVQSIDRSQTENAQGQTVRQFRFRLNEEVAYDATLAFFFSHQNAAVFLDGEPVYSLSASPRLSIVRTPGSNWAMVPLYREDAGKEVLVELTPVYENYQDQQIEFLVGSRYAICAAQLLRSLPELLLSFVDVLMGLLLLSAAVYFSCRRVADKGLYALALLSVSLGLWNFTQTRFAPLLFGNRTVFLYYLSLTMLMVSVLPLIQSVRRPEKKAWRRALQYLFILACVLDLLQLLLQLTGRLDLRQSLTVTHLMLLFGALCLMLNATFARLRGKKSAQGSLIWLLGAGILADLMIYYFGSRGDGLPVTLFAMLVYVLSEGVQLFAGYIRQQHMLEEKENQLTMSRITTMMSQIRSHFVFNVLNAISGMCKYDPEKADETVVRFARYLRNNIDIMEDDKSIPFSVELERLEDYVILEQVRFGERIRFETDIETESFLLPPLILQPVVENAIKHGLSPREEGGTIRLSTRRTPGAIVITVADDGVGFDPAQTSADGSVGLKNIRFRLRHLVNGSLELAAVPGCGTTVTITIPVEDKA